MSRTISNYIKPGPIVPRGDKLQEPIDAIREIWDYLASINGTEPFFPQERFMATIIRGFPLTSSSPPPGSPGSPGTLPFAANSPDYTDARYCMVRVQALQSNPNDQVILAPDQTSVDLGVADSLYMTATNVVELLSGNSHFLPTDGTMTVEVFATWDAGDPQQKHYCFAVDRFSFPAQINAFQSSLYHSGSGTTYGQPFAYAWQQLSWIVAPTSPVPVPPVASPPPNTINATNYENPAFPGPGAYLFGTFAGGTHSLDLGPAFNTYEQSRHSSSSGGITDQFDPAFKPVMVGEAVWMTFTFVAVSTNAYTPVLQFEKFESRDVQFILLAPGSPFSPFPGDGKYWAAELVGKSNSDSSSAFQGNPNGVIGVPGTPTFGFEYPYTIPAYTVDSVAINWDELNIPGNRLQAQGDILPSSDFSATVFSGRFEGYTPDGYKILSFSGAGSIGNCGGTIPAPTTPGTAWAWNVETGISPPGGFPGSASGVSIQALDESGFFQRIDFNFDAYGRLTDLYFSNSTVPYGATGSFTTVDLKTVTVTNGIITSIV